MSKYASRQIRKYIVREDTGLCSASRSELWRKGISQMLYINNQDLEKLKFKLNIFYLSYLRISKFFEQLLLFGPVLTLLNIISLFKKKINS